MRAIQLFFWVFGLSFAVSWSAFADGASLERKLEEAFATGDLPGLHGVYVLKDGAPFAEVFFDGSDQRWGRHIGVRVHTPDTLHDLRSVSKSVVGLLYGIALEQGRVAPPSASLIAQYPEHADLAADPTRAAIAIHDVLNMTMGIAWNEDLPYTDPRNSEIAMEAAKNRIRYVLERPMVSRPGKVWVYNGGATAVIADLITRGTGKPLEVFADQTLFAPLGITDYEWVKGADGTASAASGLRMSARDLAKLGKLVLDQGRAGGAQVVPKAWITTLRTPVVKRAAGLRYSHFWWLAANGRPPTWMAGFGNGGQRLTIQPEAGVVLVVFAGNYDQPEAWRLPVKIVTEFVIPALH